MHLKLARIVEMSQMTKTFFILQIKLCGTVFLFGRFPDIGVLAFSELVRYPFNFFYLGSFWRLQAVRTRPWIGSWGGEGIPGDQDHHHRSQTEEFINVILCPCPFSFLVFSVYDYTNRLLYTVTYIYYLILVFLLLWLHVPKFYTSSFTYLPCG